MLRPNSTRRGAIPRFPPMGKRTASSGPLRDPTQRYRRFCTPMTPPTWRTNFITARRPETVIPRDWQISSRFRPWPTARSTLEPRSNSMYTGPWEARAPRALGAISPELVRGYVRIQYNRHDLVGAKIG